MADMRGASEFTECMAGSRTWSRRTSVEWSRDVKDDFDERGGGGGTGFPIRMA